MPSTMVLCRGGAKLVSCSHGDKQPHPVLLVHTSSIKLRINPFGTTPAPLRTRLHLFFAPPTISSQNVTGNGKLLSMHL